MTIKEIFDLAIATGIENDPRGKAKITKILKKNKQDYDDLADDKKVEYNSEKFTNPYSDSAIQYAPYAEDREVKTVLVGIDADPSEILLANELTKQGKKIDLVIGHHPIGKSLANLHEVMDMQVDILEKSGIPVNISEKILEERIGQVSRSIAPINHYQPVDVAKLLNIPLINIHTPADNAVWKFVSEYLDNKKPQTVGEIIDVLKEIPEYNQAVQLNAGPIIFVGSPNSRAGKITVGMSGGTGNSEKIYEKMSQYGIGTEVDMHINEKLRDEATKHYINVVIAGHMASDSLGLNIIMDKLQQKGIEIIPCSGFIRYSRLK